MIGWRARTRPSRATRSRLPCCLRFDQRRGRRDQRREHRGQGCDPARHKPRPGGGDVLSESPGQGPGLRFARNRRARRRDPWGGRVTGVTGPRARPPLRTAVTGTVTPHGRGVVTQESPGQGPGLPHRIRSSLACARSHRKSHARIASRRRTSQQPWASDQIARGYSTKMSKANGPAAGL